MMEYCRIYTKRVQVLTQENKERSMKVSQDLWHQYEAEVDSFLPHTITSDEMWCHHNVPESKWQSVEWQYEFSIRGKS